ncbi:MAG TPA: NADPH:quinone reductase [Burkholderiaceae bacterium]|nr:NADPH:quinone reductase [Burkholderiaceae bacterium]
MQVAFYERNGPAREVLQVGELADPLPGPGEVRVRLRYSGVNPSDVKSRAGRRGAGMPFARVVPHSDGSGVIDHVGEGVSASRVGETVWVWNGAWGRPFGTAAQYIVLPARQAVALPQGTDMEAGACLGIPALTAMHAVLCFGGVSGRSVLVAGGAGAVGSYAVQMARVLGARQVIATVSSAQKAQLALQAGADATIDYRSENVAERARALTDGAGVDRVIEVDVAANGALDAEALRPGGQLVVYGSGTPDFSLPFVPFIVRNLSAHFFIVYNLSDPDRALAQETLTRLLADGRLTHHIAERLPLTQIAQAHELVESGRAVGNIVLSIP